MHSVLDANDDGRASMSSTGSSRSNISISKKDDPSLESTPLLLRSQSPPQAGQVYDLPLPPSKLRSPHFIILCMAACVFLLQMGDQLADTPQTRIIEGIFCYKYWEKADPSKLLLSRDVVGPGAVGGVDEAWCKLPQIQGQVAHLKGYQIMFDGIPSLLLAIPVGILADRIGRRPLLLLGFSSFAIRHLWIQIVCWFWQSLDIHLSWLSALHGIMGGSSPVVSALAYVVISDVTSEGNRATWFMRIVASVIVCYFIAPPLAALLMRINPWIPSFLALSAEVSIVLIMFWIPETLNYRQRALRAEKSSEPLSYNSIESSVPPLDDIPTEQLRKKSMVQESLAQARQATSFLGHDWRIPALLLAFVAYMFIQVAYGLLVQYGSTRYHTTLSTTTIILSIRSAFFGFVLLALLPLVSHILMSRLGLDGKRKDLYLARASMVIVTIGWFMVAFAPNVGFFIAATLVVSLGQGGTILVRSFITDLIDPKDVAKLYTVIGLVDTVAVMAAGPIMAALFELGLDMGGAWVGLPFWLLGVVYVLTTVLLFVVNIRKRDESAGEPGLGAAAEQEQDLRYP